jgi:crossover junction endodeoxyribonuclease RuvC
MNTESTPRLVTPRLVILALDLGTTTGWALRSANGPVAHGFVSFKSQRFEGGGMRYLRFGRWLADMLALSGPQSDSQTDSQTSLTGLGAVYFEEVRRHLGVDAAHVYGGLLATLTAWCEHHQIPYQGVPVGTIKRHATGKGNAGKAEVIAAMKALGHPVTDDNEADALALLHWAMAQGADPALGKEVRHG